MLANYIKGLSVKARVLYLVYFLAAGLFLLLLPLIHPYSLSPLLKIIPLSCLLILVAGGIKGRQRILLVIALLFCMAGDVLLDLDRSANFKPALVAFLLGHVFYIIIFQLERQFEKKRAMYLVSVIVYTVVVGFFLKDIPAQFLPPIMVYLAVISIMVLSALMMKNFSWVICAGSMIFMISDTIIAINKFLVPIPNSTVFNIGFYFVAQVLIVSGLLINEEKV